MVRIFVVVVIREVFIMERTLIRLRKFFSDALAFNKAILLALAGIVKV